MKRSNKKGFTIVELVIVIAIIAILAAVLIPTFASLIQKANTSADIQAVRQMNTYLAVNEVEEPKTINEVFKALENGGMTVKDYHPLVSGRFFFWDSKLNRVLYTDDQYSVIFPEDYKTATKANGWLSLSGEINKEKIEPGDDNTYTVKTAEQLYYLVSENKAQNANIKFDTDKLDLMGADVGFEYNTTGTYTIRGAEGGTTITGLNQITNKSVGTNENNGKKYASGLVQVVGKSKVDNGITLTISNITISGATIGSLDIGGVGAVIGRTEKGTNVTLDNVKVIDTIVNGQNKVGGLVGHVQSGTLTIKDTCTMENVTINCSEGEAAKVVGAINQESTVTIEKAFGEDWVNNVNVNLVKGTYDRKTVAVAANTEVSTIINENNVTANFRFDSDVTLVDRLKSDGTHKGYRVFYKDAYVTYVIDGSEKTINVASDSKTVASGNSAYESTATIGGKIYEHFIGLGEIKG